MIYFRTDGTATEHPTSKALAKRKQAKRYDSTASPCTTCGGIVRYTASDACTRCALEEAEEFYEESITLGAHDNPRDAILAGVGVYVRRMPCKRSGHVGLTTIDKFCKHCEDERDNKPPSARQVAMNAGEQWYTPDTPCKAGHLAPRSVNNGICKQCWEESRKGRQPPKRQQAQSIQVQFPDMVVSRQDAVAIDMKVYRTGKPCSRGHAAYRYVINNGCLECKKL